MEQDEKTMFTSVYDYVHGRICVQKKLTQITFDIWRPGQVWRLDLLLLVVGLIGKVRESNFLRILFFSQIQCKDCDADLPCMEALFFQWTLLRNSEICFSRHVWARTHKNKLDLINV